MEHRLRKPYFLEAEIADRRAQGRVDHADAHDQGEQERAVQDTLSVDRALGVLRIDVQRCRVVREGGEQRVVHFGHCSADGVLHDESLVQIFEVEAGHVTPRA